MEEREEGEKEGIRKGKSLFVKYLLSSRMPDKDIMLLAECDQELLEEVRKSIIVEE